MLEPIRYAEFCTGVGGFRLGIEASGLRSESIYTNEIDDNCEKTYMKNFGIGFDSKDIFEINPSALPDFDMLCAGFPCQPFSSAGKELGFRDSRGTVFFKLLSVIEKKKPRIVFLENVPNLVRHDKGRTFQVILKSWWMRDILYLLQYWIAHTLEFLKADPASICRIAQGRLWRPFS